MISPAELIEAIPIIISLVVIEGLLSVDNALAIAAMASHLPAAQQQKALRYGIIGAYVFRGLTLFIAAWIASNPWIKFLGAAYLIYLMCANLTADEGEQDEAAAALRKRSFWMTVLQIEIMDLSLSIDNVVAAVALSPRLWIVITGVFIGILALRFLAGLCIKLIERYPILGKTAFLLVGYVGVILLVELLTHHGIGSVGKFVGIILIVAATLIYDTQPAVKRAFAPLVRVALAGLGGLAKVFEVIFWVPRKAFSLVRGMFVRPKVEGTSLPPE